MGHAHKILGHLAGFRNLRRRAAGGVAALRRTRIVRVEVVVYHVPAQIHRAVGFEAAVLAAPVYHAAHVVSARRGHAGHHYLHAGVSIFHAHTGTHGIFVAVVKS